MWKRDYTVRSGESHQVTFTCETFNGSGTGNSSGTGNGNATGAATITINNSTGGTLRVSLSGKTSGSWNIGVRLVLAKV